MGIPFRFFCVPAESDLSCGLDRGMRAALEALQEDSSCEVLPCSVRDFSVHRAFPGFMSGHRVHGLAFFGRVVDFLCGFSASADCAAVCDHARMAQADSDRRPSGFDQMALPFVACGIAGDRGLGILGRSGCADCAYEGISRCAEP